MPLKKSSLSLKQPAYLHDNTPSPVQNLSFRKLLLSHSSIYNVLTNPDLDGLISTTSGPRCHSPISGKSSSGGMSKVPLGAHSKHTSTLAHTAPLKHSSAVVVPLSLAENSPRFPTDPLFSVTSWQSVGDFGQLMINENDVSYLSSPMKRFSLSILLLVSDDDVSGSNAPLDHHCNDGGSTIVVPYPKKVMVFETDEEEEEEDTTMIAGTSILTRKISPLVPSPVTAQDSFIMPRMTVSSTPQLMNDKTLKSGFKSLKRGLRTSKVVLILSADSAGEARAFAEFLAGKHNISIEHLILKSAEYLDETITKASCLFIINDGNPLFLQKLSTAFITHNRDSDICAPKITLINMITANYFVNLFELINLLNPYQIWKTHSLKHECILRKIENFMDCELNADPCESEKNSSLSLTYLKDCSARKKACQEAFSSLIVSKTGPRNSTNYKKMEKRFKKELTSSLSTLDHSDPLQISTSFSSLNFMSSLMGGVKEALIFEVDGNFLAFCTFTIGIGVGIGVANGNLKGFIEHVKWPRFIKNANLTTEGVFESTPQTGYLNAGKGNGIPSISKAIDAVIPNSAFEAINSMSGFLEDLALSSLMELNDLIISQMDSIRSINSLLIQYLRGGFEKALGLMLCFNV